MAMEVGGVGGRGRGKKGAGPEPPPPGTDRWRVIAKRLMAA